jgi:hypothetical protein
MTTAQEPLTGHRPHSFLKSVIDDLAKIVIPSKQRTGGVQFSSRTPSREISPKPSPKHHSSAPPGAAVSSAENVYQQDELRGVKEVQRCEFTFSDGRQCRNPAKVYLQDELSPVKEQKVANQRASFCTHHSSKRPYSGGKVEAPELVGLCADLTTATTINRALAQTYLLMAQGRISRKDAIAFGYLTQLLLQTVPGVRAEFVAAFGYHPWQEKLTIRLRSAASAAKGHQQDALSPIEKVEQGLKATLERGPEDDPPPSPGPGPSGSGGQSLKQPVTDVVEPERALRRERHAFRESELSRGSERGQELRGAKEDITPLFSHEKVNKERLSERSLREGLTPADWQSVYERSLDLFAGKYDAAPEGRREAKALALDLELMKPPDSKPPKGRLGEVVSVVRQICKGKNPPQPVPPADLFRNYYGQPIKPAYQYAPESTQPSRDPAPAKSAAAPAPEPPAPVATPAAADLRSHLPPAASIAPKGAPSTAAEPAQPSAPPQSRSAALSSELTAPLSQTTAPVPQPKPKPPIGRGAPSSPPNPFAADVYSETGTDADPLKRAGHTTRWYVPSSWSTTGAPDPFLSRAEKLRRQLQSISHSAFRRLRHQNSRGFWTSDLQKLFN